MSDTRARVQFAVDEQPQTTIDDDQEAASLLRLAGRNPATYDLARVDDNGDEVFFRDSDIVRVHHGDRFRTRLHLRFTIDGEQFDTHDDDQTVDDLLRRAGLDPDKYDLARVGDAHPLTRDNLVQIRPNDRFVTARRSNPVA